MPDKTTLDVQTAHSFPSDRLDATAASTPRRTTHSASGWTLPSGLETLRQPQDGSLTNSSSVIPGIVRSIDGRSTSSLVEAEDARLNGSLRSLARRVKGLNVIMNRPAAPRLDLQAVDAVTRKTSASARKSLTSRPQVA